MKIAICFFVLLFTLLAQAQELDTTYVIDEQGRTIGLIHEKGTVPKIAPVAAPAPTLQNPEPVSTSVSNGYVDGVDSAAYYQNLVERYTLSGEKKQYVHYLGVPLRLDWMIVSGRWLDVYLGTGVQGDFCLGATLDGKSMKKDAPAFSLLGSGGMQFNLSRRVGLYAEPGISWTVLSGRHWLETYRSEHPVVFSVSTGLRVNLGK